MTSGQPAAHRGLGVDAHLGPDGSHRDRAAGRKRDGPGERGASHKRQRIERDGPSQLAVCRIRGRVERELLHADHAGSQQGHGLRHHDRHLDGRVEPAFSVQLRLNGPINADHLGQDCGRAKLRGGELEGELTALARGEAHGARHHDGLRGQVV